MSNWQKLLRPSQDAIKAGGYVGIRGGLIDLRYPSPEAFQPEETGRTLSFECRYAGNYGRYSVAQHACLVAGVIEAMGGTLQQQLAGLHHDDSESVTGDLPNPIKTMCPDFREIERRLEDAINERYNIDIHDPIVRAADMAVFANEINKFIPKEQRWIYSSWAETKANISYGLFVPWEPDNAYARYIDLHEKLTREIKRQTHELPAPTTNKEFMS